ncbi:MAG: type II secretion system protein, partial [Candidatus Fimimonas sp.]
MKRTRKGFTITELVIVIAVIAILAAVLIPTFGNVIANSKKSHDEQYVHEMNIALSGYTVSHGGVAPKDYNELMLALAEYDLCDASNPFLLATALKQDNKFVLWYPESNTLFLMDNGTNS